MADHDELKGAVMDPIEVLERFRNSMRDLGDTPAPEGASHYSVKSDVVNDLLELWAALNEWMVNQGFNPWQKPVPSVSCGHRLYAQTHCSDMSCTNYISKCPRHRLAADPDARCSNG